jgi:UDP-3-O-[3-hydroxymyristoyl] glucosamine N-acyltransferase
MTERVQEELNLGELAVRYGLKLQGEPSLKVWRVATLSNAGDGSLSFFANSRYRRQLEATRATAVLVTEADARYCPTAALIDPNPYLIYARIATELHPEQPVVPGIHPSAVIAPGAKVAASAAVGALAVLEDGVEVGARASIGAGSLLHAGAVVGEDSRLVSRVTLYPDVKVGRRCILHAGTVIGADGFGFALDDPNWVKIPQIGTVIIGDDVEIGANTTVDRGAIDDTVIEDGVKLDNQIQIGHNCVIGAHTAVAGCTGISGTTIIGKRCRIGGGVGIAGQLSIADDVVITGYSLVSASIKEAGSYSSGMPTVESRRWRRMVAHLRRLADKER